MTNGQPASTRATLAGVRVSLVGENHPQLSAIEEHLLDEGATVQRTTVAALDRLDLQHADAVVVHLASARDVRGQSVEARREHDYLDALAHEQRVIGLLDDPASPPPAGLRDFVLPPFDPSEVAARLRRVLLEPRSPAVLRVGNLEVNSVNRTVVVAGRTVDVTFHEFELLRVLLEGDGRVLTRDDLARQLGYAEPDALSRRIDIHVHRLRSKLADLAGARIETVRNVGYRLAVLAA